MKNLGNTKKLGIIIKRTLIENKKKVSDDAQNKNNIQQKHLRTVHKSFVHQRLGNNASENNKCLRASTSNGVTLMTSHFPRYDTRFSHF